MPGADSVAFRPVPRWFLGVLSLVLCQLPSVGAAEGERAASPLQLLPGFEATLWAAEPMLQNPVAISFNDQGRCYVAETHRWSQSIFDITRHPDWLRQDLSFRSVADRAAFLAGAFADRPGFLTRDSERVTWVEDRSGAGHADVSGVFATGFQLPTSGTAAGILARDNEVWFASIPDLWHLESRSASGQADRREVLHTGFGVHIGVSGHDLHGLKFGPDGRLYFSIGDRGFDLSSSSNRVDPRKLGWRFSLQQPDTGAVLRCDPDGSNLEVFAIGLRNPQELVFDAEGNLWTGDNDTAGADESRLLHLVEGGDYGWRCSYQHQEGFGPWVQEGLWRGGLDDALPTCGMVSQGPAGFDVYPGTGFGPGWTGHFLMCDFPGGVWDFTLLRRGASFELASKRKFLWGVWPTDVEFGPDGAAYVADWVFGWEKPAKGRIHRIAPAPRGSGGGSEDSSRVATVLRTGMSGATESMLRAWLGDPDQRIRLRAQWRAATLGERGLALFAESLSSGGESPGRLHAVWGLGQMLRGGPGGPALGAASRERALAALRGALSDRDPVVRSRAAEQLGEAGAREASSALAGALRDPEPGVRLLAAIALGRLGPQEELGPVLAMLRETGDRDPHLRHAGMMALLGMSDAARLARLQSDPSPGVRHAVLLALRRLRADDVALFLNDPNPALVLDAARAINDVPVPGAMPRLAAFLGKVDCPSNIVSRAINANLRLGEARNATVLANFANRADVPVALRTLALEALGDWEKPAPLDRVMGLWRPLGARSAEPGRRALRAVAGSLNQARAEEVRIALMRCAARLGVKEVGQGLADSFAEPGNSAPLRVEILRTLGALHHSRLEELLSAGLADPAPVVRAAALELAAERPDARVLEVLPGFLSDGVERHLRQAAVTILGKLNDPRAGSLLGTWIDRLAAGGVDPGLELDLLEAAESRPEEGIRSKARALRAAAPSEDPLAAFRPVLAGGSADRGGRVFSGKAEVACLRCHSVGGVGGTVGPSLDGVGKRLKRGEILESIVRPNARIAAGFEQARVTLKDGGAVSGTVRAETDQELSLESLEEGMVRVPKASIVTRTRGLSPMPEGLDRLLTARELRDLIEYLAGL
ncbi:MAG TPA: hypothetical protein DCM86_12315 [Verrucomicrobiales bacterium]|nr:hypothetical protein [Verrucomicrobiales bacterium]